MDKNNTTIDTANKDTKIEKNPDTMKNLKNFNMEIANDLLKGDFCNNFKPHSGYRSKNPLYSKVR